VSFYFLFAFTCPASVRRFKHISFIIYHTEVTAYVASRWTWRQSCLRPWNRQRSKLEAWVVSCTFRPFSYSVFWNR
jgi:hypothetical protein